MFEIAQYWKTSLQISRYTVLIRWDNLVATKLWLSELGFTLYGVTRRVPCWGRRFADVLHNEAEAVQAGRCTWGAVSRGWGGARRQLIGVTYTNTMLFNEYIVYMSYQLYTTIVFHNEAVAVQDGRFAWGVVYRGWGGARRQLIGVTHTRVLQTPTTIQRCSISILFTDKTISYIPIVLHNEESRLEDTPDRWSIYYTPGGQPKQIQRFSMSTLFTETQHHVSWNEFRKLPEKVWTVNYTSIFS